MIVKCVLWSPWQRHRPRRRARPANRRMSPSCSRSSAHTPPNGSASRSPRSTLPPPKAGLLGVISGEPGMSQQAVARRLGTPPSRLVALVDGLEQGGLIERRRNPGDRRNYALHLTPAGEQAMAALSQVASDHEQAITAPLTPAERPQLTRPLANLAAAHGLVPGVHPGYRTLGGADTT